MNYFSFNIEIVYKYNIYTVNCAVTAWKLLLPVVTSNSITTSVLHIRQQIEDVCEHNSVSKE